MLRPLPLPRLRIILFPREPRFLPTVIDSIDEVLAELGVQTLGAGLVRSWGLGHMLLQG